MSTPSVTPLGPRHDAAREAVLERLLTAMGAGDFDAALACFAHPRYELVGNHKVYDGADEVRRYYATLRRSFPDLAFEVIEVHHAHDAVVAELWMSGTHLGSTAEVEPTGKHFRCRTAVIFSFAGDRLQGARVYLDTGTIAKQLA
jgi:predicted ester cyclase